MLESVFPLPDSKSTLITDGGLATELEARGHDLRDDLWTARLLVEAPQAILDVHRAFFAAGSMIATTASYQASFEGFAARGLDRQAAERLLHRAVRLARQAADEQPGRFVAASVGPYGAMLADGSEFRGRYGLTVAQLRDWHRPRLEVLASAEPDVLALETVPDTDEAEALAELAHEFEFPAWLSFNIEHGRTRAGQPMREAFAIAEEIPEIGAVGVNCCAPDEAPEAIAAARETGKAVIAYPNSGEGWDAANREWTGGSRYAARQAEEWAAAGARILGGCCRVGAAEIAAINSTLQ